MAEKPHRAPGTIKRTSGIGGTDASVICGLSQYRTAFELYLEKRGEIHPDETDSEIMRFGRRFEAPIADEFSYRTGRKIWRQKTTLRHPLHRYLLGNIDRWQRREDGALGVYEGKNHNIRLRKEWINNGVPVGHYLQLQHYIAVAGAVAGATFGSFGVVFGGNEFFAFDVERDDATIQILMSLEIDFWRRVKEGDPPDWDFGQAGQVLAKKLYSKAVQKKQILLEGPSIEAKIKRLLQLKLSIKTREEEEKSLIAFLQVAMGDAEVATFHGLAKVTWSNQSRRSIDIDKLKKEHPLVAEQVSVTSESRRFTIKAVDEDSIEIDMTPDAPLIISSGVRAITFEE